MTFDEWLQMTNNAYGVLPTSKTLGAAMGERDAEMWNWLRLGELLGLVVPAEQHAAAVARAERAERQVTALVDALGDPD